jgi:uncharacterized protein YjdB
MRKVMVVAAALVACGPKVQSVEVSPAEATLEAKGAKMQFSATPKDDKGNAIAGQTIKWYSTDPAVLAVDASGNAEALKSGSAMAHAEVKGVTGMADVEVRIPGALKVEPVSLNIIGIGTVGELQAVATDDAGRAIPQPQAIWSIDNPAVARLENGRVTATGVGEATVTAAFGGLSASTKILVALPAFDKIAVEPSKLEVKVGETRQFMGKAWKDGADVMQMAYAWTSSNEKVATVDHMGNVTGTGAGKAEITAAAGDKTAKASVTVKK